MSTLEKFLATARFSPGRSLPTGGSGNVPVFGVSTEVERDTMNLALALEDEARRHGHIVYERVSPEDSTLLGGLPSEAVLGAEPEALLMEHAFYLASDGGREDGFAFAGVLAETASRYRAGEDLPEARDGSLAEEQGGWE